METDKTLNEGVIYRYLRTVKKITIHPQLAIDVVKKLASMDLEPCEQEAKNFLIAELARSYLQNKPSLRTRAVLLILTDPPEYGLNRIVDEILNNLLSQPITITAA